MEAGRSGSPAGSAPVAASSQGAGTVASVAPVDASVPVPPTDDLDAGSGDAAVPTDAGAPVDAETSEPGPKPRPPTLVAGHVSGPISEGKPTLLDTVDLAAHGYVEHEYFVEGEASDYVAMGALNLDGKWVARANGKAAYKTRIVVRRPSPTTQFNGTVLVEWLNVTTGKDAAVALRFAWEQLLRDGFAYVGVSVQQTGVDALKNDDAARYGTLQHPGDAYGYDIFAQAAAAVAWPHALNVLEGLRPERFLAYGQSQSAMRMVTYINAIEPLHPFFDGAMIHSRARWGAPVGTESDGFLGNGMTVHVRDDVTARVMQFLTESELFLPLGPAYDARQPDTDHLRTWEVAGAAHADRHLLGDNSDCGTINDGPQHFVVKAALHHMHLWMRDGVPPPVGAPIDVNAAENAIARDANGNALGGIRTPAVDVPIAALTGEWPPENALNPLCMLYGQTYPFSAAQLQALYPTHQDYVDKVIAAANAAARAGFILPEEESSIIDQARVAAIPD